MPGCVRFLNAPFAAPVLLLFTRRCRLFPRLQSNTAPTRGARGACYDVTIIISDELGFHYDCAQTQAALQEFTVNQDIPPGDQGCFRDIWEGGGAISWGEGVLKF